MKQHLHFSVVAGCIVLGVAVAAFSHVSTGDAHKDVTQSDLEAVAALTDARASFDDFVDLFSDVSKEKGGVYGFELLKESHLPFGLDTHLLGHYVGDILYLQNGIGAMSVCTHDFRNACSHTMVIGALLDFGDEAFPDIREACLNAPGGKGAYGMCFHGLGHGVLAFNGYDMSKTIEMCGQLGTDEYFHQEAIECFGGAIMEIISGGGHDADIWQRQRDVYLYESDPFALCKESYVTDMYRPMCYNYMIPYAYEALGADMAAPGDDVFKSVFAMCEAIPGEQTNERKSCFGGQGKEFIGIATGRDYTNSKEPDVHQLTLMHVWCSMAGSADGVEYCQESVVDSLYWGAENSFDTPLRFCGLAATESQKTTCLKAQTGNVAFYVDDIAYYQAYCEAVPTSFSDQCREALSI